MKTARHVVVVAVVVGVVVVGATACSYSWGSGPDQPYSRRCASALAPLREALSIYGGSPQTRTSSAAAVDAAHHVAVQQCQPTELALFETRAAQRREICDAALRHLNTQISAVEPRSVTGQLQRHHTQQLTSLLHTPGIDQQQLIQQLNTATHQQCNRQETGGFLYYQTGTLLRVEPGQGPERQAPASPPSTGVDAEADGGD